MNRSQIARLFLAGIIGAVIAVVFWPVGIPQARGASTGAREYGVIDTSKMDRAQLEGVLTSERSKGWKVTAGVGPFLILEK